MADLARQVEDDVAMRENRPYRFGIGDITLGDVDIP
jgi:hypothetical protein